MKKGCFVILLAVGLLLTNSIVSADGISLDAIKKSEEGAKARGERTWEEMESSYSSGQYKVGIDIPAGEYILFAGGETGYFCVSSDSNNDNILFNGNFEYNSIITVQDGEYLELTRCYAISMSDNPDIDTAKTGMFKVGTHIPAGEYKLNAGSEKGYYCVYSDSHHDNIITNNNFDGQTYVTVSDGQYLELVRCYFAEQPEENIIYSDGPESAIPKIQSNIEPLSEDDFIVNGEGLSNTDLYSKMLKDNNAFQYFFYLADVDESIDGVITTYRGIHIGDMREDVYEKYAVAEEYLFGENDPVYNAFINSEEDLYAQIMKNQCINYVAYDWNNTGQIVFFFNSNDEVSWIVYVIGHEYNTYVDDAETVKQVQNKLNELGYNCGTPDGIMGNNTRSAIINFQRDKGLFESGIVDNQLLKCLFASEESNNNEQLLGISISNFVQRYNEAVDYYNTIAERDGYNKCSYVTENMVQSSESFMPDNNLKICVNPNTTHKDVIGIINVWADNTSLLDANVATGEIMAMFYAFDLKIENGAAALDLWSRLNENDEILENGITYDNYSFGNMVMIKAQYDGFEIIKDNDDYEEGEYSGVEDGSVEEKKEEPIQEDVSDDSSTIQTGNDNRCIGSFGISEFTDVYEEGTYKVGTDIPEGVYVAFGNQKWTGHVNIYKDAGKTDQVSFVWGNHMAFVNLEKEQYAEVSDFFLVPFEELTEMGLDNFGIFVVGENIEAGEYKIDVYDKDVNGFYKVYSSYNEEDGIQYNYFPQSQYVTIEDGQIFVVQNAIITIPDMDTNMENVVGKTSNGIFSTIYEPNMYRVGIDMPSGVYVDYGPQKWTESISISSDSIQRKDAYKESFNFYLLVDLKNGEYVNVSSDTYLVPIEVVKAVGTEKSGFYIVGKDIEAGEYKLNVKNQEIHGYWATYSDLNLESQTAFNYFDTQEYISIDEGEYLFLGNVNYEKQ